MALTTIKGLTKATDLNVTDNLNFLRQLRSIEQDSVEGEDFIAGTVIESETNRDPTVNWDDYPEFGNYAHLCRAERD